MKVCYVEVMFKGRQESMVFRVPVVDEPDHEDGRSVTHDQVIVAAATCYEDEAAALYLPHLGAGETTPNDLFIKPSDVNFILVTPVREETNEVPAD